VSFRIKGKHVSSPDELSSNKTNYNVEEVKTTFNMVMDNVIMNSVIMDNVITYNFIMDNVIMDNVIMDN
jgi:hypothetical protein